MNCLDKIDHLMSERKINKHILAKSAGIPYTTIAGLYERGVENARLSTLYKLSQFFDVSLDYLVIDKYEKPEDFTPSGRKTPFLSMSDDEIELLTLFRSLNESGRQTIMNTVRGFSGNPDLQKESTVEETA